METVCDLPEVAHLSFARVRIQTQVCLTPEHFLFVVVVVVVVVVVLIG